MKALVMIAFVLMTSVACTSKESSEAAPAMSADAIDAQLRKAGMLYKQRNYTAANRTWRPLADRGVPEAQYNLGQAYDSGEGVLKDPAQSAIWYSKAAEQGYAAAQYNLGVDYLKGDGVKEDRGTAVRWITLAAKQGLPDAVNALKTIQAEQAPPETRTKPLTGHFRADGLYVYDRTDAVGPAPVSHSQPENPQCFQLLGMLDTASSNARRVIMQNLNARGCSIPQEAVQHVAHPKYDACVAVLQQAGATDTSHCDRLYYQ